MTDALAQGRIHGRDPVAVVDIGSNSVRLVIYEGNARALTMLFNEKVLSGLGKGLAQTNRLDDKSMASALAALKRFRTLIDQAGAKAVYPLATAAAREAANGSVFTRAAEEAIGVPIRILSGYDEAHYAAQGVLAGFHSPRGVAGDLGGGSLELVDVADGRIGRGLTMPLGGLRLQDLSNNDIAKARTIADTFVSTSGMAGRAEGQTFFAVGGTWRNLAKLHMEQRRYPLHVMHGYETPAADWVSFLDTVAKGDPDKLPGIAAVSKPRRALLAYGALSLQAVIRHLKPATITISALGVREGYLFTLLDEAERAKDPLMEAATEFSVLRSRSHRHSVELVSFTAQTFRMLGIKESPAEERLRAAACLLSDVGWRAHPDYRGAQSLTMLAHAAFAAIDHPGRAYLGLANYYRHEGDFDVSAAPDFHTIAGSRLLQRAQLLAGLFRVAYVLTAATPGILDRLRWRQDPRGGFSLLLPSDMAGLVSEKPMTRLENFGRMVNAKLRFDVG